MQTIVRKDTNVSLYYLVDSKTVNIDSDQTTISDGGTPELIIADCNSSNAVLHQSVDTKSDWWGWKYKHDGSSWSANADYKGSNNLTSDINDSVTTIPVGNSNPFTASGTVQIGDEKITYTGVDGTNLTGCTRGAASTSAASHTSGSSVTQI
jgi:hypothetical protein|tara:strand:- start:858 stop:1313 length:456 start_codon:yes stop_codon:yes gene_type:complete